MSMPSISKRIFSLWQSVKKHRIIIFALCFWLLILLASRQYMQTYDLSFTDLTEELAVLLSDSWFGPLIYAGVFLIRPLILFPSTLITVLGGYIFGFWFGMLYVLLAGTASSIIPYSLGRWFSSSQNHDIEAESKIQQFIQKLQNNPFQAVLTMRLLFLPYDAVSFVAGSLKIPFWKFLLATALGNVAGIVSFVGIGASIEGDLASGDLSLNPKILVFSLVTLILSIGISQAMNRYQQHKLSTVETEVNQ